jgi:hypothetical protein
MVGMARRGAHSARHRAGRSQPDAASHDAQAADGSEPEADWQADPWWVSGVQAAAPGPLGGIEFGTAGAGRFGPMGESEGGPDAESDFAAGEGEFAAHEGEFAAGEWGPDPAREPAPFPAPASGRYAVAEPGHIAARESSSANGRLTAGDAFPARAAGNPGLPDSSDLSGAPAVRSRPAGFTRLRPASAGPGGGPAAPPGQPPRRTGQGRAPRRTGPGQPRHRPSPVLGWGRGGLNLRIGPGKAFFDRGVPGSASDRWYARLWR